MKPFAIISDNSCALQKPLRERFGLDDVVFGTITFPDGHTEYADLDYERMTVEEYFRSISKKAVYKTACANIDQMITAMTPFAKEGRDIIFLTISSALSGTYNFAIKAAEQIRAEYGVKVFPIDSMRYSAALGLLVQEASELRNQGKSAEEAAEWLEANKNNFHQIGIMDDLYFLARNGRIAKAKAFFGTMAGIKPMAEFSSCGLSEAIGKAKGTKNGLMACVAYLKDRIIDPEKHIVFISNSLREKEAAFLREEIEKAVHPKEIISMPLDQSSGANMGPGLTAAYFYGKPISSDLSEEKELLTRILSK